MPLDSLPSEPALRVPSDASHNRLSVVTDLSDIVDPFLSFEADTPLLQDFNFSETTSRHDRHQPLAPSRSRSSNTGTSPQVNTSQKPMPSTNLASRSHNPTRSQIHNKTTTDHSSTSEGANRIGCAHTSAPASHACVTISSDLLNGPGPSVDTQHFMTALPVLTDHRTTAHMDTSFNLHTSKKRKRDSTLSSNFGSFRLRNLSHSLDNVASRLHFRKSSTSPTNSSATTGRACSRPNRDNVSSPSTLIGSSSSPQSTPSNDTTPAPAHNLTPINLSTLSAREFAYISSQPLHELPQPILVSMVQALQTHIEGLGNENEQLKEAMKGMREDWYRTSEELDLERYKVWVQEGQVEALKRTIEGNARVEVMKKAGGVVGVAGYGEEEGKDEARNDLRDSGLSGMTDGTGVYTGSVIKRASVEGDGGRNKWMNRKSAVSDWETVVDEMDVDGC